MYKTIIFDFDYTLGDSTKGIEASINYALKQLGYPEKELDEIKRTIGMSLKETFFQLTLSKDGEMAARFAELFRIKADEVMVAQTELYADAIPVLTKLREEQYKICIVTTKFHYRIDQILNKFHCNELVDVIVGAEDVKIEKPAPDGLLWVIEYLNLNKSDVLYVGDSLVDAKTAQNAKVPFAGVLTGTTSKQDFSEYDAAFIGDTITDIYNYLQKGM